LTHASQVREAYEVLIDPEQREDYGLEHPDIHDEWEQYHSDLEEWERRSAAEARARAAEAEAEAERARNRTIDEERERRRRIWIMGENEKARRTAQAQEAELHNLHGNPSSRKRCYCSGCKARIARTRREIQDDLEFPTDAEYAEYLALKAAYAEQRSQEAARKRREEQDHEAQERLKREQEKAQRNKAATDRKRAAKEAMKNERSNQAARRARQQQEKDAQLRMARLYNAEMIAAFKNDLQETDKPIETVVDLGWTKMKGAAKCLFCEVEIKFYAFICPEGGAVACGPCIKRLSNCVVGGGEEQDDAGDGEEA
jgi:chemotaxis protein histidine kinase CheA